MKEIKEMIVEHCQLLPFIWGEMNLFGRLFLFPILLLAFPLVLLGNTLGLILCKLTTKK